MSQFRGRAQLTVQSRFVGGGARNIVEDVARVGLQQDGCYPLVVSVQHTHTDAGISRMIDRPLHDIDSSVSDQALSPSCTRHN